MLHILDEHRKCGGPMLRHVPVISCFVVYQRNTFCISSSRNVLEFHVSSQSNFVNILIQIIQDLRSFRIDRRFSMF